MVELYWIRAELPPKEGSRTVLNTNIPTPVADYLEKKDGMDLATQRKLRIFLKKGKTGRGKERDVGTVEEMWDMIPMVPYAYDEETNKMIPIKG